jgi:uncharacterized membrane protein
MREIMLIIHFIGLAMGLGTSFGFMFLGIAASKMEKEEARKFGLNTFALSKMGQIGLVLLIVSGLYLMTPYWVALTAMPLLIIKLVMVTILTVLIILLATNMKKAKNGDLNAHQKTIPALGRIALITVLIIVILAVLVFH